MSLRSDEVTAKATTYAGIPFGAADRLVDAHYVDFADMSTVDTSEGDGVVYRVAK